MSPLIVSIMIRAGPGDSTEQNFKSKHTRPGKIEIFFYKKYEFNLKITEFSHFFEKWLRFSAHLIYTMDKGIWSEDQSALFDVWRCKSSEMYGWKPIKTGNLQRQPSTI